MINIRIIGVAAPQLAMQIIMFGRNVLIARLVGAEYFGVCIAMLTLISAIEMFSDIGIEQYTVVSEEGGTPNVNNSLHTLALMRGALMSISMLALSFPVAHLMNMREYWVLFSFLSIYPLARSLSNIDIKSQQRRGSYKEEQLTFLISQLLSLLVAAVGLVFIKTPVVMAFSLLAQAAGYTIGSHIFSKQRYKLGFNEEIIAAALSFGIPLALVGGLNFVASQGDRILVTSHYDPKVFGRYAAAFSIVMASGLLIQKITSIFYLPKVSLVSDQFAKGRSELLGVTALCAAGTMGPLALIGPLLIRVLFGDEFVLSADFYVALGFLGATRLFKSAYTTMMLGEGRTRNLVVASAISLAGIGAAGIAVNLGVGLTAFVFVMSAGELLSTLYLMANINGRNNRDLIPRSVR